MSTNALTRYRDETIEFKEKLALAATRVLAKEALIYNMDDALEALRRLWKDGVLQKYVDKIPELQELIRLRKLP